MTGVSQKLNTMNTPKLLTIATISAGLAFGAVAYGHEKGEKEESINSSDVPQAVQQAAEEKEGSAYEAVVSKDGKEWGYKFSASGKMLGKHSEASEKGEKGEKY
jgi:hypothetical protein